MKKEMMKKMRSKINQKVIIILNNLYYIESKKVSQIILIKML
jgi:hypothetical protein